VPLVIAAPIGQGGGMPQWSCAACAVEYPETDAAPSGCVICRDERQYVPPSGQKWTSLEELEHSGSSIRINEVEPTLFSVVAEPEVGIGQHGLVVSTPAGNVLWDPPGFVDEAAAEWIRGIGGVAAIIASHPHMYGAQVSWSRMLGGGPVYVSAADRAWVQRDDECIVEFSGSLEPVPGVRVKTVGGHFPGSNVLHFEGADGRGVLLSGDTIFPGPSQKWVTFQRSFPNDIPLSAAVVDRVVTATNEFDYDRVYGNFATPCPSMRAPRCAGRPTATWRGCAETSTT